MTARYSLDPTGVNRDNAVVGEVHELSTAQYRAVAPTYGPFFTEGLVVYDNGNNQPLIKNTDYICVELLQEPTLKYGKEIAQLILILNNNVSSTVRINYQVLGGWYTNSADAVAKYYETLQLDQRPVDFKNVLNKPLAYPPSLHKHLLNEIVGFEPLVASLERIRNAISLADVPAYEALIEWVKIYVSQNAVSKPYIVEIINNQVATLDDIKDQTNIERLVDLEGLLAAMKSYNFNSIKLNVTIKRYNAGDSQVFIVDSTNLDDNTNLYWTIEHIDTDTNDFASLSGVFGMVGNQGSFNVSILSNAAEADDKKFKVAIRKDTVNGVIVAETSILTITGVGSGGGGTGGGGTGGGGTTTGISLAKMLNDCCFMCTRATKNAKNLYYFGD